MLKKIQIPARLTSRKLWVFVASFIAVLVNYIFNLKMPDQALYSLVGITSAYILGQGYVDGKQQPIKELPVNDIVSALTNIVDSQLVKIPTPVPLDQINSMFKSMLDEALSKLNVIQLAPVNPTPTPVPVPEPKSIVKEDPEEQTSN